MFDTIAGKFEKGPYFPKDESRNPWETKTRKFFDAKLDSWQTTTSYLFNRGEARIAIYGDRCILRVESSLPKLLHGNNLKAVCNPELALTRLQEFVADHLNGEIPDLSGMEYMRVDYCHNFQVGSALADYVHTLSNVSFLKHRRTTDGYGGVEWWSKNGRMIRAYDKFKEILEKDKKTVAEARGILRFEIEYKKKSGFLQRRQQKKKLMLQDVLRPEIAYSCLVETLNRMCVDLRFVTQDAARNVLDEHFSYRKATRLLGFLRRLDAGTIDDHRKSTSRSTFFSDKQDLKGLGLWPPSAVPTELPGLQLPPLEELLSEQIVLMPRIPSESPVLADCRDSSSLPERVA
jgi:hypothetical protein